MFIDVKLDEKIANGFTRLAAIDIVDCFRAMINNLAPQRYLSKEQFRAISTAIVDELYFPTSEEDILKMQHEFEQDLIDRKSSDYGKSEEGSTEPEPETPAEESPKYTTLMDAIRGKSADESSEDTNTDNPETSNTDNPETSNTDNPETSNTDNP